MNLETSVVEIVEKSVSATIQEFKNHVDTFGIESAKSKYKDLFKGLWDLSPIEQKVFDLLRKSHFTESLAYAKNAKEVVEFYGLPYDPEMLLRALAHMVLRAEAQSAGESMAICSLRTNLTLLGVHRAMTSVLN